jgi:hypothetical protein
MAREDLLVDFLTHNLTPAQTATWSEFAQHYLVLNFRDRGYAIYQLHG